MQLSQGPCCNTHLVSRHPTWAKPSIVGHYHLSLINCWLFNTIRRNTAVKTKSLFWATLEVRFSEGKIYLETWRTRMVQLYISENKEHSVWAYSMQCVWNAADISLNQFQWLRWQKQFPLFSNQETFKIRFRSLLRELWIWGNG